MLFLQVAAQNAALLYFAQFMSSISLPEKGVRQAWWMMNQANRNAAGAEDGVALSRGLWSLRKYM